MASQRFPTLEEMPYAATLAYSKGNLRMAERICHHLLLHGFQRGTAYSLLSNIAADLGKYEKSVEYISSALHADPANALLQARRSELEEKLRNSTAKSHERGRPAFLLIKAWGQGFGSDLDHVLGQLLLAEMLDRVPVVHWGGNSLFSDSGGENAFEYFFEPVSSYSIHDLIDNDFTYFPPKWSASNLLSNDVNKAKGEYSQMAGLYYLNRTEDVLVSDYHTYLINLVPWIDRHHEYYGWQARDIYRHLFKKYIRPKPEILAEIEAFRRDRIGTGHTLAVHARGSGKISEIPKLAALNELYHGKIEQYLSKHPQAGLFLITDSENLLQEYRNRYPDRLIVTDCARTSKGTSVHFDAHPSRKRIGVEVLKDMYLASRCDYFIGNGMSNVTTTILHMRDWRDDEYEIFIGNRLYELDLFVIWGVGQKIGNE